MTNRPNSTVIIDLKNGPTNFIKPEHIIGLYYKEVNKTQMLDNKEERCLINVVQTSVSIEEKHKAMTRLVEANLRLVIAVAKKYGGEREHLDLINEGNIGLMEAIKRFDLTRESTFASYAIWWIRQSIVHYIKTKRDVVRDKTQINKCSKPVTIDPSEVHVTNTYNKEFISIDETSPFLGSESATFEGHPMFTGLTSTNNTQDDNETADAHTMTNIFLGQLKDGEREIIKGIFGIGRAQVTYTQMAIELGVSRHAIVRRTQSALKKMRDFVKKEGHLI